MGNLDYKTTAEDIHELFKDYDLKEARVPTDPERGIFLWPGMALDVWDLVVLLVCLHGNLSCPHANPHAATQVRVHIILVAV